MNTKSEIRGKNKIAIVSQTNVDRKILIEKLLILNNQNINNETINPYLSFTYRDVTIEVINFSDFDIVNDSTKCTFPLIDCIILLIDYQEGIEVQVSCLKEIYQLQNCPVIIFINQIDNKGQELLSFLDELEQQLKIAVCPCTWPIRVNEQLKGLYNLTNDEIQVSNMNLIDVNDIHDPGFVKYVGAEVINNIWQEIDIVSDMFESLIVSLYKEGLLAPVFFGDTNYNLGIKELHEFYREQEVRKS